MTGGNGGTWDLGPGYPRGRATGIPIDTNPADFGLGPERWFPCEHPERPLDFDVVWHGATPDGKCHGCSVAVSAWMARGGPDVGTGSPTVMVWYVHGVALIGLDPSGLEGGDGG